MNTKTRAALLSIAVALLLATVVTWSGLSVRAMPDTRNSPAFDTLTEAPVWTSPRYLRSTEAVTTTDEGNGEERELLPESFLKVREWLQKRPGLDKEHHNYGLDAFKKWWASAINSLLRKDNEVKRLVKNVKGADAAAVISILEKKHMQRWFNMGRSAEDIHGLLGLPTGPALLKSPLVWIWLDYAVWIGRESKNPMDTINVFKKLFGSDLEVAKMFAAEPKVATFEGHRNLMLLEPVFWRHSFESNTWEQVEMELINAGVVDGMVLKNFQRGYNYYHLRVKAPEPKQV